MKSKSKSKQRRNSRSRIKKPCYSNLDNIIIKPNQRYFIKSVAVHHYLEIHAKTKNGKKCIIETGIGRAKKKPRGVTKHDNSDLVFKLPDINIQKCNRFKKKSRLKRIHHGCFHFKKIFKGKLNTIQVKIIKLILKNFSKKNVKHTIENQVFKYRISYMPFAFGFINPYLNGKTVNCRTFLYLFHHFPHSALALFNQKV